MHETDGTSLEAKAEYAERSFQNWQAAAAGWEAQRDILSTTMAGVTRWILGALDPHPGETMLELASGPGELALELAPRLRPGGRLICTDRSPNMVEAARRATQERRLEDVVDHRAADAHKLAMEDGAVDAVVCRLAYMLMADPGQAFRETRRVLRDNGRVAFVVWAAERENPWATAPFGALERNGWLPPAEPGGPGMFSLAESDRRSAVLAAAGLQTQAEEALPVSWRYAGFDEFWDVQSALNGGIARLAAELPAPQLERLCDQVRSAIDPYRADDGGYLLHGMATGVLARP